MLYFVYMSSRSFQQSFVHMLTFLHLFAHVTLAAFRITKEIIS